MLLFFLFQKDFDICLGNLLACLFLLQRDFDIVHVLLFEGFLRVFNNSYLSLLYIEKYFIKNIFISCFL